MSDTKDMIKNLKDGETEKVSGGVVSGKASEETTPDHKIVVGEYGMPSPKHKPPVLKKYGGPPPKYRRPVVVDYGMPQLKHIDPKPFLKQESGENDTES